ncbi:FGGY family carbohydrate kinase [Actinobaculum sp. 352]|uniref:FGGY family carbohydrate kinase n=1 Tax=Actinobaculum sp. 352 TaxID=2490946 RepID=UPI000F7E6420|nr:FGGY family carbohydrate kinase [Actinobaculum sp. 352]RTE48603.1 hypothetical protein EKN07_09610 [Actinobaculum sp. 352]
MKLGYIAIDEGTTNCKVLAYSQDGAVLAEASRTLTLRNPAAGHFEQDAAEILSAVDDALAQLLADLPDLQVRGISISNQRESVVVFDCATATPLTPVIGWQDSRTTHACQHLIDAGWSDTFRAATGLHLDPMYSATKMAAALDLAQGSITATTRVGTIDALLVAHLTGGAACATDPTNASRTLLYNIHAATWDPQLCEVMRIPMEALPQVRASNSIFGTYGGTLERLAGVPVVGVLGDSHAALYGQHCSEGIGKVTFGTGSSIMIPTASAQVATSPVDTTIGFTLDTKVTYAREGNVLAAGAGIDTAADLLRFPSGKDLVAAAADTATTPLTYVPAFSGLAAPWWDRDAVGLLVGLRRDSTNAQVARAVIESVGHQLADIVDVVRAEGTDLALLRADGGLTRSPLFVQATADILDVAIETADQSDISAYGAARMCATGLGELAEFDSGSVAYTRFESHIAHSQRQQSRRQWRDAINRSRTAA